MAKAFKLEQERFLQKSARQMEMLAALIAQQDVPQAQQSSDAANPPFRGDIPLADTPHHGVMNHDNADAVDAILDVETFTGTGGAREPLPSTTVGATPGSPGAPDIYMSPQAAGTLLISLGFSDPSSCGTI